MNEDERTIVQDRVEMEGFDYTFRFYSDFDDIQDKEFHRLRAAYKQAAEELAEYIGTEDM